MRDMNLPWNLPEDPLLQCSSTQRPFKFLPTFNQIVSKSCQQRLFT